MRCSRCEKEFADSATICPNCGTPTHTGVATTYSYLPVNTPSWPTSIPQRMPQQVSQATSVAHPARSARRGVQGLLIALAIVILTPLIGAGITLATLYAQGQFAPTPTAHHVSIPTPTSQAQSQSTPAATGQTNQLPTPSSFKKTSNSDLNISLQYPSDWQAEAPQKDSSSDIGMNIHPTQSIGVDFQIIRFSPSASSQFSNASGVIQANLSIIQNEQGVHNLQSTTPANSQPTIGGAKWTQGEATFTDDNSVKYHITVISVQHNKNYYTILASSPDMYYSEAMKKYIQPMLDSFQFLS